MIRVKKLEIEHFMNITKASLDFENGVNLIIGENGAGKSSILNSIAVCLNEDKKGESYKDYIQNGFDHGTIKQLATISGKPIEFNIKLNRKSGTPFERTVNYEGKEYKNSEVTDLLDSFDLRYYSPIIMSMQGEDDITKLSPSQREKFLQKLLNFDFSDKVNDIDNKLNEIKENIIYNKSQIDADESNIKNKNASIKDAIKSDIDKTEVDNLKNKITELGKKVKSYTNSLQKEKELLTKNNSISRQISSIQASYKVKESTIENYKNTISNEYTLKNVISEKTDFINKNKAELESLKEDNEKNKNSLSSIKENVIKYRDTISKATAEKKYLIDKFNLVKSGKCPTCGKDFSSNDMTDLESHIKKYDNSIKENEDNISAVNEQIANIESKINSVTSNASSIEKDIMTAEIEVKNANSKLSEISEIKNNIKIEEENIKALKESLNNLVKEQEDVEKEIKECSVDSEMIHNANDEISKYQSIVNKYNEVIAQNIIILENNEKLRNDISDLNINIEKLKTDIESFRKRENVYVEAKQILNKTLPDYLIVKTCSKLESEMNNFIHVVFPLMEVRLYQNKRGVEFFYTTDKTKVKEFKKEELINVKMASGFEKAILSTAFKVSLCKAYGLDFAFFDEIDGAGTEENSERMFKSLVSNDIFSQVFIITHKPSVRDVIMSVAPKTQVYYVKKGNFSIDEN